MIELLPNVRAHQQTTTVVELYNREKNSVPLDTGLKRRKWLLQPAVVCGDLTEEKVEDINKECLKRYLSEFFNEEKTNVKFALFIAQNSIETFLKYTQRFHNYNPSIVAMICAYKLLNSDEYGELFVSIPIIDISYKFTDNPIINLTGSPVSYREWCEMSDDDKKKIVKDITKVERNSWDINQRSIYNQAKRWGLVS